MAYSPQVLDYFHHPRHAGEMAGPTVVAESANPVCGDVLKLWVIVREGKMAEVRFKAAGCVPAVACGSWLAEWLMGRELSGLKTPTPEEIEAALGGLPAASRHASALAAAVLNSLLTQLANKP